MKALTRMDCFDLKGAWTVAAALAIAGGLVLMFNFATGSAPAFAAPPPDECKGQNKKNPECQGDDSGREDTVPASSGFRNAATDDILSDCATGVGGDDPNGNNCYVDGEDRVHSSLGGQRPARFVLKSPKKSRDNNTAPQITLDLSDCVPVDEENEIGGCQALQDILGQGVNLAEVTDENFVVDLRPYRENCPDEAIPEGGDCGDLNVFTMDPDLMDPNVEPPDPVPMGLWIYLGKIEIDFASRIDPDSSIQPGACAKACLDAGVDQAVLDGLGLADVMVTASDIGEFVNTPDQNNSWTVEAAGVPALVCRAGVAPECIAMIDDMRFSIGIERAEQP